MKFLSLKKVLTSLILLYCLFSHGQVNNALHFDGVADYVSISPSPIVGNPDFTVEMWITVDPAQTVGFKRALSIGGPGTRFEIGSDANFLAYFVFPNTVGGGHIVSGNLLPPNTPIHLAVVKSGSDLLIYLDCILVVSEIGIFGSPVSFGNSITLGKWSGTTADQYWFGSIDEVKVWDHVRSLAQIESGKNCGASAGDPALLAYFSFNQGIAGGSNAGENTLTDVFNTHIGTLNNFALTGPTSNWVTSQAPIHQPNLSNVIVEVVNYFDQSIALTEICNDDPAHFSLTQNGQTISPQPNTTIQWEYSDDGNTWNPLSNLPFASNTAFPTAVGDLHIDCTSNSLGYKDRQYRSILEHIDPSGPDTCIFTTPSYDLKICCPLQSSTVVIQPDDPACEGDTLVLNIQLNSPDVFVNTPGSVQIDWTSNDPLLDLTSFQNQLTFTTTYIVPPLSGPINYCITATVTTACNKSASYEACIQVDPEPKCGYIEGKPQPPNLMLQSSNPNPIYTICRGNDSTIGMISSLDFENCIPTWEYSFDNVSWTFLPEGSLSNPDLNTNTLPWGFFWNLGADRIFYRIQCNPLSDPSGCEPCYSDTLEIQLIDTLTVPIISGPSELCLEDFPDVLSIQNPIGGIDYDWYFDTQFIGSGTSITAQEGGCYWVEASNVCESTLSNIHCIESCEIVPVISCPLPPNDCACLGDPISLSAADSEFNCVDNSNLVFDWSWLDAFGNSQTSQNTIITDTPPIGGTTYTLTVTDPIKNCRATTTLTIIPCDKN